MSKAEAARLSPSKHHPLILSANCSGTSNSTSIEIVESACVISLDQQGDLVRDTTPDSKLQCEIVRYPAGSYIRCNRGSMAVNGVDLEEAWIYAGDQIVLDTWAVSVEQAGEFVPSQDNADADDSAPLLETDETEAWQSIMKVVERLESRIADTASKLDDYIASHHTQPASFPIDDSSDAQPPVPESSNWDSVFEDQPTASPLGSTDPTVQPPSDSAQTDDSDFPAAELHVSESRDPSDLPAEAPGAPSEDVEPVDSASEWKAQTQSEQNIDASASSHVDDENGWNEALKKIDELRSANSESENASTGFEKLDSKTDDSAADPDKPAPPEPSPTDSQTSWNLPRKNIKQKSTDTPSSPADEDAWTEALQAIKQFDPSDTPAEIESIGFETSARDTDESSVEPGIAENQDPSPMDFESVSNRTKHELTESTESSSPSTDVDEDAWSEALEEIHQFDPAAPLAEHDTIDEASVIDEASEFDMDADMSTGQEDPVAISDDPLEAPSDAEQEDWERAMEQVDEFESEETADNESPADSSQVSSEHFEVEIIDEPLDEGSDSDVVGDQAGELDLCALRAAGLIAEDPSAADDSPCMERESGSELEDQWEVQPESADACEALPPEASLGPQPDSAECSFPDEDSGPVHESVSEAVNQGFAAQCSGGTQDTDRISDPNRLREELQQVDADALPAELPWQKNDETASPADASFGIEAGQPGSPESETLPLSEQPEGGRDEQFEPIPNHFLEGNPSEPGMFDGEDNSNSTHSLEKASGNETGLPEDSHVDSAEQKALWLEQLYDKVTKSDEPEQMNVDGESPAESFPSSTDPANSNDSQSESVEASDEPDSSMLDLMDVAAKLREAIPDHDPPASDAAESEATPEMPTDSQPLAEISPPQPESASAADRACEEAEGVCSETAESVPGAEPPNEPSNTNESVADVLARMRLSGAWNDDADEAQAPPMEPVQEPVTSASPESPEQDVQPDTVQDYMSQLFARLRGDEPQPAPAAPPVPRPKPIEESPSGLSNPASPPIADDKPKPLKPKDVLTQQEYRPSQTAPEKLSTLAALRQVANQSVQTAIRASNKEKKHSVSMIYLGGIGVSFFLSTVLFIMSQAWFDFCFLCGIIFAVLCAGFGFMFMSVNIAEDKLAKAKQNLKTRTMAFQKGLKERVNRIRPKKDREAEKKPESK